MSTLPISVVVVARNEAANLSRCLASVRGWTAESIVALNETTDASEEVAQSFGAIVRRVAWRGYRDTKNEALAFATQPWILSLDADEEVSAALQAEIRGFLTQEGVRRFAGAKCPRKVWFIDRWILHGDWYPDHVVRLVQRGRGRWGGDEFVHERMECDGPLACLHSPLLHYSFPTLGSHIAKIAPFAELFLRQQQASSRHFSPVGAAIRPVWRFFRGYVLKRGFLDGFPGFYIAWATAFGTLVRHARVYEAERAQPPPQPPR